MTIKETFGRRITNIYLWQEIKTHGVDEAIVYLKLDNEDIIEIPYSPTSPVFIEEMEDDTVSLFADLSDIPEYHVNKKEQSIKEIIAAKEKRANSRLVRFLKFFGVEEKIPIEYFPHKITYAENQLKHLKNQRIVDFLYDANDNLFSEKGFLLLENNYVITEKSFGMPGTGEAGLHSYPFNEADFVNYAWLSDSFELF